MADEAAESFATSPLPEVSSIPMSLSELSAADSSSAEDEMTAKAEAEAASMLGLPDVPGTVPNAVHDDLSEVAAEVESELAAHRAGREIKSGAEVARDAIRAASEARFREEMPVDAADAAESEQAADDAEFAAIMHGEDSADADVNASIEHDLANEDAADVDIAADSDAAADVASIDSEMEAATADSAEDSIDNNKDVQDMKSVIAQLQAEIQKTKEEGARM